MRLINNTIYCNISDTIVAEAHNQLGIIYEREGKFNNAIFEFTQALRIRPKLAEAYYGRGLAYFLMNDYDRAWDDIQSARFLGYKDGKIRGAHLSKHIFSSSI